MEWPIVKLGDICDFQNGFAFKSKLFTDIGVPILRISNIQSGSIDLKRVAYTDPSSYKENLDRYRVVGGDLLIAMSGATTGKIGINNTGIDFLLNQRVGKFVPSNELDKQYLYYYLSTQVENHLEISAGAAQPNLSTEQIKGMKIPFPPIPEQKRIVAILDQAFADIEQARAKTEQNLKNARELFESTCSMSIFSMDSTPSLTVIDVAAQEKGAMRTGPFGSQLLKREIVDEGIAVLGIDNAVHNSFQWGAKRFITPEKFEELSRFEVKAGDVLITIMGTCGRCAIVPEGIPKAINTKHICCITLDSKKCLPEYLHAYFLYHPIAREYLFKKAKGAIMAGLNMGIIKELPLVLPTIKVQKEQVLRIKQLKESIEQLEATYKSKLAVLDELKKSILQKAFSGELTKTLEVDTNKGAVA